VPSSSSIWPGQTRLGHWPNAPDRSDDLDGPNELKDPDNPDGAEYPDESDQTGSTTQKGSYT